MTIEKDHNKYKKELEQRLKTNRQKLETQKMTKERQNMIKGLIIVDENLLKLNRNYVDNYNWKEISSPISKEEMNKSHDEIIKLIDYCEYLAIKKSR